MAIKERKILKMPTILSTMFMGMSILWLPMRTLQRDSMRKSTIRIGGPWMLIVHIPVKGASLWSMMAILSKVFNQMT
uniref:Uncharacterized protein n=1 Tax=Arundo donax TaxID=35708 RepID=A0A0A9FKY9_ARUDO